MTFEEYNRKIDEFSEKLDKNWTQEVYDALTDLQYDYMNNVLIEYKKTIGDDPAKEICFDLLEYAVHKSESGSSIRYVDTKELADKVDEIIWDEIGDYMLDPPEIYQEKSNGMWAISCMFGGAYVPEWDEWRR